MPLYEYKCSDCNSRFEYMQKANDPPKKKCPKCGSLLIKIISASALQFKGQGWYVTDYSRKKDGPEDKAKSSSENKSESKPESKPASSPTKNDAASSKSKKD
jgi:putative FmdB family regulatory protein